MHILLFPAVVQASWRERRKRGDRRQQLLNQPRVPRCMAAGRLDAGSESTIPVTVSTLHRVV